MTLHVSDLAARLSEVERAVSGIGYQLDRLDGPKAKNEGDSDDLPKDLPHITPAYKRALWIVIVLNVGYGLIEMVGGFISRSQALKADALDFLGRSEEHTSELQSLMRISYAVFCLKKKNHPDSYPYM